MDHSTESLTFPVYDRNLPWYLIMIPPHPAADFEPPSPPTLAQSGYHKGQTKKVLKHARAELMKEVNVLILEG